MHIYLLDITFIIDDSYSLKDKRKVIQSMLDYVRNTKKMSAAELSLQDSVNMAHCGFVTISNSKIQARKMLDKLFDYIESTYPIQVTDYVIEER